MVIRAFEVTIANRHRVGVAIPSDDGTTPRGVALKSAIRYDAKKIVQGNRKIIARPPGGI